MGNPYTILGICTVHIAMPEAEGSEILKEIWDDFEGFE
jgi:hypothetical protein